MNRYRVGQWEMVPWYIYLFVWKMERRKISYKTDWVWEYR